MKSISDVYLVFCFSRWFFSIFYFTSKARDDQCTKRSCYGSIKHIVREGKIDSHINEVSVSEKKKRTKEMIKIEKKKKKNKRSKISIVPLEFRERILYPKNVCTIKMNNTLYKIYIHVHSRHMHMYKYYLRFNDVLFARVRFCTHF